MKVRQSRVGWPRRAPKTRQARRKLMAKCGPVCFLAPGGEFPVCRKVSKARGKCVVDCEGVRAAYARARQYKRTTIAAKALQLACRSGCGWAKRQQHCAR